MLDFIPNILTIALTIFFPTYASYKALCTHDPALLTPWLTYFLTLSLVTTVESLFSFILAYLPFYAWLRLILHLYLLLPGEHQGATFLYTIYIRPFLVDHDAQIEHLISTGHDRAKAVGLDYLKRAVKYMRALLLGESGQQQVESRSTPSAPSPAPAPAPATDQQQSYAQLLLARFSLPNARPTTSLQPPPLSTATPTQPDIYALLSSILAAATSASPTANPSTPSHPHNHSSPTTPSSHSTPTDQLTYLRTQTDRLRTLLGAFDNQAQTLAAVAAAVNHPTSPTTATLPPPPTPTTSMKKSRSETEFEAIEHGDAPTAPAPPTSPAVKKAWGVWGWGSGTGGGASAKSTPLTLSGPAAGAPAEGEVKAKAE